MSSKTQINTAGHLHNCRFKHMFDFAGEISGEHRRLNWTTSELGLVPGSGGCGNGSNPVVDAAHSFLRLPFSGEDSELVDNWGFVEPHGLVTYCELNKKK